METLIKFFKISFCFSFFLFSRVVMRVIKVIKVKAKVTKRSIFMPLPPLPLPLPLPFCSSNTSSYPILQIGSGQSLPHPYFKPYFTYYELITRSRVGL